MAQEETEELLEEDGNDDILELDDFVLDSASSRGDEEAEGGDVDNPVKEVEIEEEVSTDEEEGEEEPEEEFEDDENFEDDGEDLEDDVSVGGIGLDDA